MGGRYFLHRTAATEIYSLSLHDALPISPGAVQLHTLHSALGWMRSWVGPDAQPGHIHILHRRNLYRLEIAAPLRDPSPGSSDRKSTRLNSSHSQISYAVFCLKKKTYTKH